MEPPLDAEEEVDLLPLAAEEDLLAPLKCFILVIIFDGLWHIDHFDNVAILVHHIDGELMDLSCPLDGAVGVTAPSLGPPAVLGHTISAFLRY